MKVKITWASGDVTTIQDAEEKDFLVRCIRDKTVFSSTQSFKNGNQLLNMRHAKFIEIYGDDYE